jgi:hypothetical protein
MPGICAPGLPPHLEGLEVERVSCGDAGVVIEARSRSAGAECPACGSWSSRVHSGYLRTVQDGPARDRARIVARDGLRIEVDALEAIDGTPVADVKPAIDPPA